MSDDYTGTPYALPQGDPSTQPQAGMDGQQAYVPQTDPFGNQPYAQPQTDPFGQPIPTSTPYGQQAYQDPNAPYQGVDPQMGGAYQQMPYASPNPYQQQYPPTGFMPQQSAKSKTVAGILGILLGAFGAHKFYLGYTTPAIIMLLVSLLTCGLGAPVMGIIGLIEGIMYLTKDDMEFYQIYELGQKNWF